MVKKPWLTIKNCRFTSMAKAIHCREFVKDTIFLVEIKGIKPQGKP
ncbi:hypothetical protein SAMN03080602_03826 [Arenibacter troitsensis]|uniref:Uncharacterized protein n=1 Tax=Arenibacter troitsensis TaxID=188872 RepID=A0A1X7L6R2_9FLAO|nr:hypothetical protein SAMN03080602_03826 [Arenibacter troitsensis]